MTEYRLQTAPAPVGSPRKRLVLRPEMTVGEVLRRWPHTRLNIQSGRWDIDPEQHAGLTLAECAARIGTGVVEVVVVSGGKVVGTECRRLEVGLGTPAISPREGWVDPASNQSWNATHYRRSNATPGSAPTIATGGTSGAG